MTKDQVQKFHAALEAAEITTYEYEDDICTHFYNDGVSAIVKPDYTNEQMVAIRSTDFGGRPKRFNKNIQVTLSNFADIHELKCAGDYDQITKFIDSLGSISLSDAELKILLDIDKKNYEIIPETGDYNRFRYLSDKAYNALTDEEKAAYDAAKKAYEDKINNYIGQNVAASITL